MKMPAFFTQKPARSTVALATIASAAFLGTALVAQYGFGLHPCHLCMYQRYPYALIIAIGAVMLVLKPSEQILWRVALFLGFLFIIDGGIAFYHAGVEWGIFPGPSGCTNDSSGDMTIEQMREAIRNAALVPCDQAMAHIFGLSLAAWNAIAAFGSAALTFILLKKFRHA